METAHLRFEYSSFDALDSALEYLVRVSRSPVEHFIDVSVKFSFFIKCLLTQKKTVKNLFIQKFSLCEIWLSEFFFRKYPIFYRLELYI